MLAQRLLAIWRVCVRDRHPQRRPILRRLLERFLNSANAFLLPRTRLTGTISPSVDREDRLDGEQLTGPGLRAADAPAAGEELERVDGEHEARLALERLDQHLDLLVRRPALEAALDTQAEQRDAERRRLGVDDADPLPGCSPAPSFALSHVPENFAERWSE